MYRPAQLSLASPFAALGPMAFASLLRNWWAAADYNASTGNWTAKAGSAAHTLAQGTASKRPTKTSSNAAFGNKPTVDADGVDDELKIASAFGASIQPNTIGILFQTTGAVAGDYIVGQYASSSYQFYRANHASDTLYTDPSAQTYSAAGVATTHLFLLSKTGTTLTAYKDGASLGTRTMNSSSGTASDFYLFSAGGGYIQASVAELFTVDRAISAFEAVQLSAYFRGSGYPL